MTVIVSLAMDIAVSNNPGRTVLITGSTLGFELARAYAADTSVSTVIYTYRTREPVFRSSKVMCVPMDLTCERQVEGFISQLDRLDGVVNTVGLLHEDAMQPEKSIARVSAEQLMRSLEINTLPTLLLAKHSRRVLRRSQDAIFATISAKVGSIEDNRLGGWYSYRATKAALNMAVKTLAIEWRLALPNCTVAALHPGTFVSPLSKPFTRHNNHVLFPEESATHLKTILDRLRPEDTGRFWAWNGEELPW
ncbi:MAG: SDR family NAD(P)-dependent oxidoreductase [Pseudomonadota bacterium]